MGNSFFLSNLYSKSLIIHLLAEHNLTKLNITERKRRQCIGLSRSRAFPGGGRPWEWWCWCREQVSNRIYPDRCSILYLSSLTCLDAMATSAEGVMEDGKEWVWRPGWEPRLYSLPFTTGRPQPGKAGMPLRVCVIHFFEKLYHE